MEGLGEAAMISLDTLLDFSSDFDEEDDGLRKKKQFQKTASSNSTERRPQLSAPAESDSVVLQHGEEEEEEEEELEWISNQDAFPSIETTFDMNHQSPVSVLSTSNLSSATTIFSSISNNGRFSLPVQARRSKRRRRSIKGCWGWFQPVKKSVLTTSSSTDMLLRKCSHCSAEKTPQWRAGPLGPKTLCNACGVRYKSGRLVPEYRPASSPSFSSELHSNSHRRIVEMRRKKHKGNVHFTLKRN